MGSNSTVAAPAEVVAAAKSYNKENPDA